MCLLGAVGLEPPWYSGTAFILDCFEWRCWLLLQPCRRPKCMGVHRPAPSCTISCRPSAVNLRAVLHHAHQLGCATIRLDQAEKSTICLDQLNSSVACIPISPSCCRHISCRCFVRQHHAGRLPSLRCVEETHVVGRTHLESCVLETRICSILLNQV